VRPSAQHRPSAATPSVGRAALHRSWLRPAGRAWARPQN